MNRPYVICHMLQSIDGKVTGDFLTSQQCEKAVALYYAKNRDYKADAFACGRVTMEESFTGGWYPDLTRYAPVSCEDDFVVNDKSGFYAVAFDPKGKLGWQSARVEDEDPGYGNAQVIEIVTGQADPRYLRYLESMGISYLFAGEREMDIAQALYKLKTIFGIDKLLLEGGSILNGAFQRAGVIDELSLVVTPTVAGAQDKPLFADSCQQDYHLTRMERHTDVLWLNYQKQ